MIRWTTKHAVFVHLLLDDGHIGTGECWCFDTSPEALVVFLRTEVAPNIIGLDITEFDSVVERLQLRATLTARHGMLASALSGVDIAIWDLRARLHEQSLASLLSADQAVTSGQLATNGTFELYSSGGLYGLDKGIDDLVREMTSMVADGFTLLKMKVGGESMTTDCLRVEAVLAAIPSEVRLIIDGVYSYAAKEAIQLYEQLPTDRIEAFQSPVVAADIEAMAWLCHRGVPVMGTEAEYRPEIHQRLVDSGAIRFLQTAPIASGGITRLRELDVLVKDTPIQLSLEVSSTAIAMMAACHFAAACDTVAHVEYHTVHQVFFEHLALQPSTVRPGRFCIPDKPGLGIDLPEQELQLVYEESL